MHPTGHLKHGGGLTLRSRRMLEKQIQQTCAEYLELDGWRRIRTDPVSDRSRGKGFGTPGMADDLFIRYGLLHDAREPFRSAAAQVLWCEWKMRGGRVSPKQRVWIDTERARGALVLLAGEDFPPTIDGFIKWYEASGLCRRVR